MKQLSMIYESKEQPRMKELFVSKVKICGVKKSYLAGELGKEPSEFSEMLSGANHRRYDIDQFQITLDNLHEAGSPIPKEIAQWFADRYCKSPEQSKEEAMEEIRDIGRALQVANERFPELIKAVSGAKR